MNKFYFLKILLAFLLFCFSVQASKAQVTVSGTVYDITKRTPIEAVSVLSTSGRGTTTDIAGRYSITLNETDSIYFSYLNKATPKYPVASIVNMSSFDISIMTKIAQLPSVFVRPRDYRFDSMQNRKDYARIFDFRKPGLKTTMDPTPGGIGAGLDLDELINMFNLKKNRRTLAFQNRLLQQEQDKYIDHRYSKALVRKLTGLTTPELEDFMKEYRPTYDMSLQLNELEFGQFIIESYQYYKKVKAKPNPFNPTPVSSD